MVQIIPDVVGMEHITLRFACLGIDMSDRLRIGIDFPYGSAVHVLLALKNYIVYLFFFIM